MPTPNERPLHLVLATLLIASLFLDQEAGRFVSTWNMPKVGLLTFAIGMTWIGWFTTRRIHTAQQRLDVLAQQLEHSTQRTDALEDDLRRRRSLPL
ncbi:hypothetical protein LBMAG49_02470 [Planctomycetota bacterium]|jgi:hypothetical protein|nr:hypothetical protein LBMAG49_02470 [Planctomycetota bacterium]